MKRRVDGFSLASLKVGRNGLGLCMAGNVSINLLVCFEGLAKLSGRVRTFFLPR